ncbi:hypothetical protein [Bradyrhizobium sp. BRP56]|uniref:hypothetical protein n=1 Tax=Bradyrhizobium sp. BRP56 TaxID=2793819 RepID=UPI001CD3A1D0|nr:hypothetical protein [Bradyrhizobium sp. BRP56]MCA1399346.1 hypothetical protein [Bradyrhizobium sp. BRP56]
MARRPAARKKKATQKSEVFSTRIRPDIKERLEKAAAQSGRTLSNEFAIRLVQSFSLDDKIHEHFFDRRTYLMLRMAAAAIERVHPYNNKDGVHWLDDPFLFDAAIAVVIDVLSQIRPPSQAVEPMDPIKATSLQAAKQGIANLLWTYVQLANDDLALNPRYDTDRLVAIVKSELGNAVYRAGLLDGTMEKLIKSAGEGDTHAKQILEEISKFREGK